MKGMRIILLGTASLVPIGCADGALGPIAPEAARRDHAAMAGPTEVSGTYAALVDFATLTLTPRGENCLLVVDGELVFSGAIEGTAVGTTTALVFGPCSEVGTTPPGTFQDVFTSELHFVGTVDGEPHEHPLEGGERLERVAAPDHEVRVHARRERAVAVADPPERGRSRSPRRR